MAREADDAPSAWQDALAEGVILADGGRVRSLNRAAAELLRVDPALAVGRPLISVLRDHRLERAALDGGEVEIERAGRTLRAVGIADGLLLRDVTAERSAREGARELLAVLSHELRTPVTTIRATLEALRHDLPEAQRERFLARAEGEAARLVRLLEDLTAEATPPRNRRVPLREVAERARGVLAPLLAERGVRLEATLPDVTVWADEDKLLQVILNLVENAAVHGPGGEVRLTGEREGDRLAIAVRDLGRPLDGARIEALFEPNARGDGVKAKGTGLGLSIVRAIAERWGGRAWGRPLEGGNEFGVTVPLEPPAR